MPDVNVVDPADVPEVNLEPDDPEDEPEVNLEPDNPAEELVDVTPLVDPALKPEPVDAPDVKVEPELIPEVLVAGTETWI